MAIIAFQRGPCSKSHTYTQRHKSGGNLLLEGGGLVADVALAWSDKGSLVTTPASGALALDAFLLILQCSRSSREFF